MKKYILVGLFFVAMIFNVEMVLAKRGCCSHHGGEAGCNEYGRTICKDNTLSPSCTCTPTKVIEKTAPIIYGCTDKTAKNYNKNANENDNSCIYYKKGCTDKNSINYDENAEIDDGSCIEKVVGCMNSDATNYNPNANVNSICTFEEKNKSTTQITEEKKDSSALVTGLLTLGTVVTSAVIIKKRH